MTREQFLTNIYPCVVADAAKTTTGKPYCHTQEYISTQISNLVKDFDESERQAILLTSSQK